MTDTSHHADGMADDQHWFDLLAGRAAADARHTTRTEAAALRRALQRHHALAPEGQPAAADARITRLLDRARAEGVLPTTQAAAAPVPLQHPPPPAAPRPRLPSRVWGGALAASIAALAGVLWLAPGAVDGPAPESVQRGAALQQVQSADPAMQHRQLLLALRAAGFEVQAFERLGRPGLDVALPVPLSPVQARALANLGLTPPAGPSLVIEFVPAAPAPAAPAPSR